MKKSFSRIALIYWLTATAFYFYQYVLRVSGGLLTDTLMHEFQITASAVGTIMSVASFSYVFMQIPAGATTDYFGVKWILPVSCLLCGLGCYVFVKAHTFEMVLLGRGMIGVGAAYAFICSTKIISLTFHEKLLPMMVSMTILIGSSGGFMGTGPLAKVTEEIGWRSGLFYVALGGIILAAISLVVGIRFVGSSKKNSMEKEGSILEGLLFSLRNRHVLILCAWGFCIYMPICVFADTWGVPYLMIALNFSKSCAADQMSLIYFGLIIGCPFYGWLGGRTARYDLIFSSTSFCLIILFYLIFWQITLITSVLPIIMVLVGFFISVQLLMFPAAVRHVPVKFTASTIGLVNTATMISGAIFQKLVGLGVDWIWDGQYYNGIPHYGPRCYAVPLSVIILFMGCSFVISFFIKEKSQ